MYMMTLNKGKSENEQMARALVREFDAAWDARDVVRFASFFTKNSDMNFYTLNRHMRGRDEVTRTYTKIFSELDSDVKHRTTINEMHSITRDVMLLDATTDIVKTNAQGKEIILRRHIGASIMVQTQDGWRIRALRIWSESITTE
jgi:uncharacterized protein (TIGR02246 family)